MLQCKGKNAPVPRKSFKHLQLVPLAEALAPCPKSWGTHALVCRDQPCCAWCPWVLGRDGRWRCAYGGPFTFGEG